MLVEFCLKMGRIPGKNGHNRSGINDEDQCEVHVVSCYMLFYKVTLV